LGASPAGDAGVVATSSGVLTASNPGDLAAATVFAAAAAAAAAAPAPAAAAAAAAAAATPVGDTQRMPQG